MSKKSIINRRGFLKSSAVTAGALAVAPLHFACASSANPTVLTNRSNFGGVQIGAITYSFRSMPTDPGSVLLYAISCGLGSLEMMGDVAERYAGRPTAPNFGPQIRVAQGQELTPEQIRERDIQNAAREAYNEELRAWRLSTPMSKYEELGKIYREAGVNIHILKLQPNANMTDAELDYVFNACKAIGAMGLTVEIGLPVAERAAAFAAKHGKYLILHNHAQFANPDFEGYDAYLKYDNVRFNFDMGHYAGSTGRDPREIVEKYHERIASIHIKDKTGPNSDPANTNRPWGQGETPLREFLLFIKSNAGKPGWPVHCDIELEYEIPANSDAVIETRRCVDWARNAILG